MLRSLLLTSLLFAVDATPEPRLETLPPDPPVTLRLAAEFRGFAADCVPEFRVTVENVGVAETFVPLGTLLNGGRRQVPDNLNFRIRETAAHGDQRTYFWQPYPIGGTLHDALVPLGAGSSHSVRVSAATFTTESGASLAPYQPKRGGAGYSFILRGKPNRDPEETLRIAYPPVWRGELLAAEVLVPPCGDADPG